MYKYHSCLKLIGLHLCQFRQALLRLDCWTFKYSIIDIKSRVKHNRAFRGGSFRISEANKSRMRISNSRSEPTSKYLCKKTIILKKSYLFLQILCDCAVNIKFNKEIDLRDHINLRA